MHNHVGMYEKGGQMYYTCKCGVGTRVFPVALGNNNRFVEASACKVIQVVIMHDIADGLVVTYHCDNGCSYTETLQQQMFIHRHALDAKSAVIQLNRILIQKEMQECRK